MHKTLDAFVGFKLMTLSESATARSVINHFWSLGSGGKEERFRKLGESSQDTYCKSILATVDGRNPAPVDR